MFAWQNPAHGFSTEKDSLRSCFLAVDCDAKILLTESVPEIWCCKIYGAAQPFLMFPLWKQWQNRVLTLVINHRIQAEHPTTHDISYLLIHRPGITNCGSITNQASERIVVIFNLADNCQTSVTISHRY